MKKLSILMLCTIITTSIFTACGKIEEKSYTIQPVSETSVTEETNTEQVESQNIGKTSYSSDFIPLFDNTIMYSAKCAIGTEDDFVEAFGEPSPVTDADSSSAMIYYDEDTKSKIKIYIRDDEYKINSYALDEYDNLLISGKYNMSEEMYKELLGEAESLETSYLFTKLDYKEHAEKINNYGLLLYADASECIWITDVVVKWYVPSKDRMITCYYEKDGTLEKVYDDIFSSDEHTCF